ncbi:MAG: hypothetical protein ACMG57_00725 [Candidatus Dojkabacteria bacterium]
MDNKQFDKDMARALAKRYMDSRFENQALNFSREFESIQEVIEFRKNFTPAYEALPNKDDFPQLAGVSRLIASNNFLLIDQIEGNIKLTLSREYYRLLTDEIAYGDFVASVVELLSDLFVDQTFDYFWQNCYFKNIFIYTKTDEQILIADEVIQKDKRLLHDFLSKLENGDEIPANNDVVKIVNRLLHLEITLPRKLKDWSANEQASFEYADTTLSSILRPKRMEIATVEQLINLRGVMDNYVDVLFSKSVILLFETLTYNRDTFNKVEEGRQIAIKLAHRTRIFSAYYKARKNGGYLLGDNPYTNLAWQYFGTKIRNAQDEEEISIVKDEITKFYSVFPDIARANILDGVEHARAYTNGIVPKQPVADYEKKQEVKKKLLIDIDGNEVDFNDESSIKEFLGAVEKEEDKIGFKILDILYDRNKLLLDAIDAGEEPDYSASEDQLQYLHNQKDKVKTVRARLERQNIWQDYVVNVIRALSESSDNLDRIKLLVNPYKEKGRIFLLSELGTTFTKGGEKAIVVSIIDDGKAKNSHALLAIVYIVEFITDAEGKKANRIKVLFKNPYEVIPQTVSLADAIVEKINEEVDTERKQAYGLPDDIIDFLDQYQEVLSDFTFNKGIDVFEEFISMYITLILARNPTFDSELERETFQELLRLCSNNSRLQLSIETYLADYVASGEIKIHFESSLNDVVILKNNKNNIARNIYHYLSGNAKHDRFDAFVKTAQSVFLNIGRPQEETANKEWISSNTTRMHFCYVNNKLEMVVTKHKH